MSEQILRTKTGKVISRSGEKSLKVAIDYKVKHPKYGKYVRRRSTFAVHDEKNQAKLGDVVVISPCRPYSRMKSWRLIKILEKAI